MPVVVKTPGFLLQTANSNQNKLRAINECTRDTATVNKECNHKHNHHHHNSSDQQSQHHNHKADRDANQKADSRVEK